MHKRWIALALAAACASSEPKDRAAPREAHRAAPVEVLNPAPARAAASQPPPAEPAAEKLAEPGKDEAVATLEARPTAAPPMPAKTGDKVVSLAMSPPPARHAASGSMGIAGGYATGSASGDAMVGGMVASRSGVSRDSSFDSEPRSPGVQAGSSDDNLAFNAFLQFLQKNGRRGLPDDILRRIIVEVRDAQGLPVFGASVVASDGEGHALERRRTYSDGRALVFPASDKGTLRVEYGGVSQELPVAGPRLRSVQLDVRRRELRGRVLLDVAFIIDTTGSMGDEIERLKKTLDVIHFQLAHLDPAADVRFGLVEYKDRGDEFVTRPIPFTSDIEKFRASLANLRAGGGGDEPEDVQAGLERALHGLQWRDENAVKVAFLNRRCAAAPRLRRAVHLRERHAGGGAAGHQDRRRRLLGPEPQRRGRLARDRPVHHGAVRLPHPRRARRHGGQRVHRQPPRRLELDRGEPRDHRGAGGEERARPAAAQSGGGEGGLLRRPPRREARRPLQAIGEAAGGFTRWSPSTRARRCGCARSRSSRRS